MSVPTCIVSPTTVTCRYRITDRLLGTSLVSEPILDRILPRAVDVVKAHSVLTPIPSQHRHCHVSQCRVHLVCGPVHVRRERARDDLDSRTGCHSRVCSKLGFQDAKGRCHDLYPVLAECIRANGDMYITSMQRQQARILWPWLMHNPCHRYDSTIVGSSPGPRVKSANPSGMSSRASSSVS